MAGIPTEWVHATSIPAVKFSVLSCVGFGTWPTGESGGLESKVAGGDVRNGRPRKITLEHVWPWPALVGTE